MWSKWDTIPPLRFATRLLDSYCKTSLGLACHLFKHMPEKDNVIFNALLIGYSKEGFNHDAIDLFFKMQDLVFKPPPNSLLLRQQIHSFVVKCNFVWNVFAANALLDFYSKHDRIIEASKLFDDSATYASILRACANLASLTLGKQLHSHKIKSGCISNGSALVDTYAKCGSIKEALQMFQEMPVRNSVSWNALVSAYAQNGGDLALRSFEQMVRSGLQPSSVSFLSILFACSRCGLVDEGLQYFNSMTQLYKLVPRREYCASIVDTMCSSGRFDEAEKLIALMLFEPDEIKWSSILNSCRFHMSWQRKQLTNYSI